jgi:hypothetical protein
MLKIFSDKPCETNISMLYSKPPCINGPRGNTSNSNSNCSILHFFFNSLFYPMERLDI